MKALIKWGLMGTLSLVLLLVAAGLLIPVFVDVNDYKPRIESLVTEKTGRDFSLGGEIDLSLFPWVGVRLADVRLGNPKGFSSQDMVQVDAFEVRLKVMPLLQRRVEIKTFRLDSPRIYLERLKNGRANWVLEPPQAKSPTGKSLSSQGKTEQENREPGPGTLPIQDLDIAQLALIQGMVSFKDHGAGLEKELSQLNLSLKGVRLDQPIDLEFSARLDGQPLSLTGRFGPLGPHPGRENIPLDLKLRALGEIDLSLMGSLLDPMGEVGLEAGISLAPFSPRKLVKALGRDFPVETQDPSVLGKLGLDTYFKGNAGEVFVRDGKLVLDDSLVKFSARAKSFEKPDLTFDLELDRLDLDRYLPPKKGTSGSSVAGAAPPSGKGAGKTSTSPTAGKASHIDYGPLRTLVISGRVKAGELKAANARVRNLFLQVRGHDGLLFLDPLSLDLYQGTLKATADVDVRGKEPRVKLALDMDRVQAGPLVRDVQGKDIIEGSLKASMNLSLTGDTPERIKATLTGEGEKVFSDGAIKGIDIAAMVRQFSKPGAAPAAGQGKPKTDFAELRIPFTVGKGISRIQGASLKSPLLRVTAQGHTQLIQETLDFRVVPKLVATLAGQGDTGEHTGLSIPLRVTGTFAQPKVAPDMENFIKDEVISEKGLINRFIKDPKGTEKELKGLFKGLFK